MSAYRITKKGYRKILKWAAQNIHDDYLADFSMEGFLDEQEYDLNESSITLVLPKKNIGGAISVMSLFYDSGDLTERCTIPTAHQTGSQRESAKK